MAHARPNSPEVRKPIDNLSQATGSVLATPQPLGILHIISDLSVAGAEMKLYKLLAATNRKRFAPTVVSMRDRGELRDRIEALGVPVYSLGVRGSLPGPISVSRLVRIVRRTRPSLIHGWMYHGNLAAQFAAAVARERPAIVWSVHQSLYGIAYEKRLTAVAIKLGAYLSRRPERIVYVSKTSSSQHEMVGYKTDQAQVIHYGFDTEKFAPSEEARCSVRKELGLTEDAILIGLVGRYHPVKDHGNFMRAAKLLSQSWPDVHFVLCGKEVDHHNAALLSMVNEGSASKRTYLLGERRDIERVTAALDIAVSSSYSEGFPNVVGEAMSSGVPCVVTAVSDLPDIVGQTGCVVPPRDSAALAAAIHELIALGPEGRRYLGAAARARVIECYSLESSVAQYETIYESIRPQSANHRDIMLSSSVRGST